MNLHSLKLAVIVAIDKLTFDGNNADYEKLAISSLLYYYCKSLIESDSSQENYLKTVVSSYAPLYYSAFKSMKNKFLAYDEIISELKLLNKTSLLKFKESEIEMIHSLYMDKTVVEPFSIYSFSQYMYKIRYISNENYTKLSENHRKVFSQIAVYYIKYYGISENDIEIKSSTISSIPGKIIQFSINNISASQIKRDIENKKIIIPYESIKAVNPYVEIVTK